MKKTAFIFFFFFSYLVEGQTISSSVVASQGDYFNSSDMEVSWTIGEVVTETYNDQNTYFTQGFEQPFIIQPDIDSSQIIIFPNPSSSHVKLILQKTDSYIYKCYDLLGNIIFSGEFFGIQTEFDVSSLKEAMYVFVIQNQSGDIVHQKKLIKN